MIEKAGEQALGLARGDRLVVAGAQGAQEPRFSSRSALARTSAEASG
jgi:hypothetical protein